MPYTAPSPADLRLEYPAFAGVDDAVIQRQIESAQIIVTTDWIEADYSPAILAHAAYKLAANGAASSGGAVADIAAMGVTSFKSADMSVSFDGATIANSAKGGYASNRYGQEFLTYLRRNRGGPFLAGVCA